MSAKLKNGGTTKLLWKSAIAGKNVKLELTRTWEIKKHT